MAILRRRFSRLVVSLASIVTLLLTGCKIDGTVELQADGNTKIDLTFEDSDGKMTKIHQTCKNFRVMFLGQVKFIRNPKIEDVTPPGGYTTCRVTSNEPFDGTIRFTENKDTYSFVVPDMHNDNYIKFQTRIVVTMPARAESAITRSSSTASNSLVGAFLLRREKGKALLLTSLPVLRVGGLACRHLRALADFLCGGGSASAPEPWPLSQLSLS